MVEGSRNPAEWIVVTGDRGLASRVRAAGGKVSSPADFFARFGRDAGAGEARPETGAASTSTTGCAGSTTTGTGSECYDSAEVIAASKGGLP